MINPQVSMIARNDKTRERVKLQAILQMSKKRILYNPMRRKFAKLNIAA